MEQGTQTVMRMQDPKKRGKQSKMDQASELLLNGLLNSGKMSVRKPAFDEERIKAILADKQTFTVPKPPTALKENKNTVDGSRGNFGNQLQISKVASHETNPF